MKWKEILEMMRDGTYDTLEILRRSAGLHTLFVISQKGEAILPFSVMDVKGKSFDTAIYCAGKEVEQLFGLIYGKIEKMRGRNTLEKCVREFEAMVHEVENLLEATFFT